MKINKNYIISLLILSMTTSLFSCLNIYAGEWTNYGNGIYTYKDDNNNYVRNEWRWIDSDNNGIAECYRFDRDGFLVASMSMPDGKKTNQYGQWIQDGIVQKVYFNSFIPLKQNAKTFVFEKDISTYSGTKRINASSKDLEKLAKQKTDKNKKNTKTQYLSPKIATLNITDNMIKAFRYDEKNPNIDKVTGQIIKSEQKADEDIVRVSTNSNAYRLYGVDMKTKISSSKNYKPDVESANIYGGGVWEHCMCLEGSEAFIKITLDKMNYMRLEVAHQKHSSDGDGAICYLELYIDDEFIYTYDEFVDNEPMIIEEWFDEGEKTVKLRWFVEEGPKGRKLYIKDARLNKVSD